MNLLKAALYDPAVAVSKATTALLALTAFDTTNLRLAITVPAHGMVRFRLRCCVEGATTPPGILLGVLNGAAVVGRVTPLHTPVTAPAATNRFLFDAEFTATGLTPGAMNVDAAYGVELIVALTNIKYGGPNNVTTDDAWGGFVFEAWDPQPLQTNGQLVVDANGRVDVSKVAGTTQTARDLGLQLDAAVSSRMATFTLPANFSSLSIDASGRVDLVKVLGAAINALVSGRMDSSVGAMATAVITSAAHAAGAIDAAAIATDAIGSAELAASAVTKIQAGLSTLDAPGVRSAVGLASANLDTQLVTIASYIDTEVAAILAAVDTEVASILADTTNIKTRLPAALVGGRMDSSIGALVAAIITSAAFAVDAIDASALKADAANEIADALLDRAAAVEALTPRQLLRLMAAVLLGKASGLAGTTAIYRDLADTKDRVTATVDASGNRTAVVRDGT